MKMAELERRSGVGRETIRYYIREGLLPERERRARNVADRIQAVAQLAGGSIIVVATVVRLAVFDGRLWVALTVLAFVLVVAVGAAIAGVVLPGLSFNALQRRRGELLEMFVVAMIYPLCFWIMDIYQLLRDLK